MNYDVDISYIIPPEAMSKPETAGLLKSMGMDLNSRGNYVAKLRDPRTARALAGASDEVKEVFKASGFAFISSGLKLPTGTFDRRFEGHLTDVVKRLQENSVSADLRRVKPGSKAWNGFDIGELLVSIGTATPIDVSQASAPMPKVKQPKRRAPLVSKLVKVTVFGALAWAVFAVI